MKDFEADELSKIELVREKFMHVAKLFSFELMDTSPIESLATLEAKSGSAIREEIYHFTDKGNRDVALRFDFTIGLARYVCSQQSLRLPAKLGSFGGVFRYDEPQKGRYRFFHQWNVEIFGRPSLESEAEVIEFASRLFDSLGLHNIEIQINHRRLVESYIRSNYPDFDPQLHDTVFGDSFRLVDKAAKKSRDVLLEEYKHMPRDFVVRMLDFALMRGTPEEIESELDITSESWDYLKKLWQSLQNRSIKNIKICLGIVRGLDYYSGTVFEAFDTESKLGAIAGGGRYDALTKAFGRNEIGATGIAGGVERTILTMDEQKISYDVDHTPKVSVLYVNADMQSHAVRIASRLRAKNIPVDVDLVGRHLKKQLESASSSQFAIIVGPRELEQNNIVLRNMTDRTESIVNLDTLLSNPADFRLKTP